MSSRAPTAWVPFISEEIGTVLANVAQRFPRSRSRRKPKLAGKARDHVARAAQQSHLRGFFSHHVERKTSQPAVDRNTPATGPPPVSGPAGRRRWLLPWANCGRERLQQIFEANS